MADTERVELCEVSPHETCLDFRPLIGEDVVRLSIQPIGGGVDTGEVARVHRPALGFAKVGSEHPFDQCGGRKSRTGQLFNFCQEIR
jgi:hypothetical protein